MPQPRDWKGMRESIRRLLIERTGEDIPAWNRRIRATGIDDAEQLRRWLTRSGVTGYPRMLLVMERFGYPDFMLASADELIDGQYASFPALRKVYEGVVAYVGTLPHVQVQARKTYVSLLTPKRTFARVQRVSRDAVAVALRLDVKPVGRLTASKVHESTPVQLLLRTPADLDRDAKEWIRRARVASE